MRKLLKYIWIFLFTAGCEEVITWNLDTQVSDIIVVEGMLTNEMIKHQVKLSRTVDRLNEVPEPVSGAVVTISDQDTTIVLNEFPSGSGIFMTDSVRAVTGKIYTLNIKTGEKEFSAEATMVPVTPLDSLSYSKANKSGDLFKLNFDNTEDEPSMTEYWLDWTHVPGFTDTESCRAKVIFYNLNTVDAGEIFKPESEEVVFPAGTIVYRRKYSLNEAQAAFIRTLLSETEWRGGLFDVQPGNVQTNLSEGAVGYFSASTVISDSTIISP